MFRKEASLSILIVALTLSHALGKPVPPSLLEKGDTAFLERREETKAREALAAYEEAYKNNPSDTEAAWRVAMGSYVVGHKFTKDPEEKKKIHSRAKDIALGAADKNDNCAACHFWGAINLALYGEAVGSYKMVSAVNKIKKHLNRANEIDPKIAYAGAHRLLGTIEMKLPGILGGDNARAKEHFEKAISHAPDEPLNYLFLMKLYAEELEDPITALEVAKKGAALPNPSSDRVESVEAIQSLKDFVAAGSR